MFKPSYEASDHSPQWFFVTNQFNFKPLFDPVPYSVRMRYTFDSLIESRQAAKREIWYLPSSSRQFVNDKTSKELQQEFRVQYGGQEKQES